MINRHTLAFRIIQRILIITVSLFVVILTGYYYYTRYIIIESTRKNAMELAGNLSGSIEQVLQPLEKIPRMMADLMEMGIYHRDSLLLVLENIVLKNPEVYGSALAFEPDYFPDKGLYYMLYAFRAQPGVRSVRLGGEDYPYFYMDWYQIPATLQVPYWSEPYYDEGGGNILMATYSVPFYCKREGQKRFAGIATVDIGLEWLSDIVGAVKIYQSGYAFVLSRNGVAVTHPDKSQIMNKSIFSNAIEWQAPDLREVGRDLRLGNSRFREYHIPGRPRLWIYYRTLESNLWALSVVYPDREMFAPLRQMTLLLVLLVLTGLGLLALGTINIINRLAAPLTHFSHSARLIAEGNFHVQLPRVTTQDEMKELHDAFSHMQQELAQYVVTLQQTTAAKEKIESELRIAREIQLAMIPHSFPPFPDLPQVDLFAMLKSAREVGGDLYDFFAIEKRFFFAIGDVSGKGVPASLFMAVTRTLLRSIADKYHEPVDMLAALNKALSLNNESNMFVTFFLGILHLDTGLLAYANAGHNPPVLIRATGKVQMFEQAGAIPLGLMEDFSFRQSQILLEAGDRVFAYTDGVTEAEDAQEKLFAEDKMLWVIRQNNNAGPRELVTLMEKQIEAHVKSHPQSDDITMMTIKYNGKS